MEELERRGFDGEDLRYGVASRAVTGIQAYISIDVLLRDSADEEVLQKLALPDDWSRFRIELMPDFDDLSSSEIVRRIWSTRTELMLIACVRKQTIAQTTSWDPPLITKDDDSAFDENLPLRRGRWLFDRFTRTYVEHWSKSSLYEEWRYMHSGVRGCKDSNQMSHRRVDVDRLSRVIAAEAVSDETQGSKSASGIHPSDFNSLVIEHLQERRFAVAVSILDGVVRLRPEDPDALNNLGFCLLPTDPSRAIVALEKSIRKSKNLRPITYANLALAYLLVGDPNRALDYANQGLAIPNDENVVLWETDFQGNFQLLRDTETHSYIQNIVAEIDKAK